MQLRPLEMITLKELSVSLVKIYTENFPFSLFLSHFSPLKWSFFILDTNLHLIFSKLKVCFIINLWIKKSYLQTEKLFMIF